MNDGNIRVFKKHLFFGNVLVTFLRRFLKFPWLFQVITMNLELHVGPSLMHIDFILLYNKSSLKMLYYEHHIRSMEVN